MSQTDLFHCNNDVEAVSSVLRAWPNRDVARAYFDKHAAPELVKEMLRTLWLEAWFIDIAVVCNPNPGKMGIGVYARSVAHGSLRYAEAVGDGNAAIAVQIAAERAATIAVMRSMKLVVLRSNTKFLEARLNTPSESDRQTMPLATKLFEISDEHKFVWTPDTGEAGLKIAKELASSSLH